MDITVVTLVEEQMCPWKGNLPKLPIESNIVRLATTSIGISNEMRLNGSMMGGKVQNIDGKKAASSRNLG
ncbi:hypothetical protein Tco_1496505 [Tanacetum coccineum]